ncbi:GreA/GreB family elongation factor [Flavobacteriaceae bacterium F08102]|nr:GreA/GreB family elongation factor [Flavobacteriaceae bacterium F08102]
MKYNTLVIEKAEFIILKRLLNVSGFTNENIVGKSVHNLLHELESATILDHDKMPSDVVRINSSVTVVSAQGWEKTFTLVLPKHSDVKKDKISILTPMGAAVIGYAEGDEISWEFPSGKQNFSIKKVVQADEAVKLNVSL